jgi:Flp pilus assembly protein TadG
MMNLRTNELNRHFFKIFGRNQSSDSLSSGSWKALRSRLPGCDEEGGAMVEMAVVLPILLLIVTAIYAFGIALNNYLQLTDGVSIGARLLAISAGQTTDPCAITVAAIEHASPQLKTANLTFTFVLNGTTYSGTSCSSTSTTTGAAGNLVAGQPAQVTVTYPCNLAVYGKNYAPSCTMVAQTTEIVQ